MQFVRFVQRTIGAWTIGVVGGSSVRFRVFKIFQRLFAGRVVFSFFDRIQPFYPPQTLMMIVVTMAP